MAECFAGTLTIEPGFVEGDVYADFCAAQSSEVALGEPIGVEVAVFNGNSTPATFEGQILVDGSVSETFSGSVSGGSSTTFTVTSPVPESPGDYSVEAEIVSASPS